MEDNSITTCQLHAIVNIGLTICYARTILDEIFISEDISSQFRPFIRKCYYFKSFNKNSACNEVEYRLGRASAASFSLGTPNSVQSVA